MRCESCARAAASWLVELGERGARFAMCDHCTEQARSWGATVTALVPPSHYDQLTLDGGAW